MITIRAQRGTWIGEFQAPAVPRVGDYVQMQPDSQPSKVALVLWERSGSEPDSPMIPRVAFEKEA